MSGRVVLVTAVGDASGSKAAAAALACAGSDPDRPGLLIDVGGRPPRPTLIASAGARELEERLAAHLPQLRAASRGQTCHLARPRRWGGARVGAGGACPWSATRSPSSTCRPPPAVDAGRGGHPDRRRNAPRRSRPRPRPDRSRSPRPARSRPAGQGAEAAARVGVRTPCAVRRSCPRCVRVGCPRPVAQIPFGKRNFSGARVLQ